MLVYYLNGFGYSFLSQKAFWCRLRSLISLFPLGGLDFSAEFSGLLRSSRESIRANESLFFIKVARKEHFFGVDRGYLLFHNPHMKNFFPFSFFGRSIIAFGHSQNMSNRKGRKNFVYSSYRTQSGSQMQEIGLGESEQKKNCDATSSEELKRGLRLFNEKKSTVFRQRSRPSVFWKHECFSFFCFPALHRSIQFLYSVYSFNVSYPQTCLLASVVLSCINGPKGR